MKTVKALVSFASVDAGYMPGQVFEIPDACAAEYIECGYCALAEKEDKADAVRDKNPASKGTNKPNRRKAAPTG